jgi:hypothetical protein
MFVENSLVPVEGDAFGEVRGGGRPVGIQSLPVFAKIPEYPQAYLTVSILLIKEGCSLALASRCIKFNFISYNNQSEIVSPRHSSPQ